MVPLAGASLVAVSRTMDNRHHWQDVLIGSLVGLVFAYFAYRQYFPSLADVKCHLPYRPRIDHDLVIDPLLPSHVDDTHASTHGMHPVSPGGHYIDNQRSSSDTVDIADEPDRTYERIDPPVKAHVAHHSNGSGQNLIGDL